MGVGQRLADARVARGLSVAEVAAATRLRSTVIERIEAEQFERLDEPVFVRGYLKAFAQVVGLDPADVVAEYMGVEPPVATEASGPAPHKLDIFTKMGEEPLPARRNPTGLLVALSLIVLVALIAWVKLGPGASSAEDLLPSQSPSSEQTPTDGATPAASETPSAEPSSTLDPTPTGVDPSVVTVQVRATAACWFSAVASTGEVLLQKTLQDGDTFTFIDASQITVRIGNAGALQLTVNGVELGALGSDGQVVDRVFVIGDPTAL